MKTSCLLGHKWNGCTCARCGKQRDEAHKWTAMDGRWHEQCAVCGKKRKPEFDPANGYRFNGKCMDEKTVDLILHAINFAAILQPEALSACESLKGRLQGDAPMLKKGDLMLALACLLAFGKGAGDALSADDKRYIGVIPIPELTQMLEKPVPGSETFADNGQPLAIALLKSPS